MKKTNKMMSGVLTALVAGSMAGCNSNSTMPDEYNLEKPSFEAEMTFESNTSYEQTESHLFEENETTHPPAIEESFPIDIETEVDDNESFEIEYEEIEQTENDMYMEETLTDPPTDSDCSYWEWDQETEAYYCEDMDSSYANHYFYGGHYYANQHALMSNPNYQSSMDSYQSSSSSSYKSGIGSGSPGGFGG
ncbi:hypothetical protein [Priestia abyssalis]|uniref:hypothetical protein n=1 Tax=Priestia abyssalis TaxID=1221450 RepID=UPI001F18A10A|nr:hypothetical protein [Priestia abyssalis]